MVAGQHHDVLQEHAVVEPTADFQLAIDQKDQPDRRVEKAEIARGLVLHANGVALFDADQTVEVPANFAAAAFVGLEKLIRVIGEFGVGLHLGIAEGGLNSGFQALERGPGQYLDFPWLHIGPAGRAGGQGQ